MSPNTIRPSQQETGQPQLTPAPTPAEIGFQGQVEGLDIIVVPGSVQHGHRRNDVTAERQSAWRRSIHNVGLVAANPEDRKAAVGQLDGYKQEIEGHPEYGNNVALGDLHTTVELASSIIRQFDKPIAMGRAIQTATRPANMDAIVRTQTGLTERFRDDPNLRSALISALDLVHARYVQDHKGQEFVPSKG